MQFDAEVTTAVRDTLAILPAHVSTQFTADVETNRHSAGPCDIHTLEYDRLHSPVCQERDLPAGVSMAQIISLLDATIDRFGNMWKNKLVLNIKNSSNSLTGRLLIIENEELDRALKIIYPEHDLTVAEKRTLCFVLCGFSMREAADLDGVAHDTKRSQIKSVKSKTGLSRQTDLATYTLTRLLLDAKSNQVGTNHSHEFVRDYHKAHLPSGVRLHVLVGNSGRHHRVLDMGPADGKAFIALHPLILPYLRKEDINALHTHNIRLIWPLRNGTLSPSDTQLDFKNHIALHMESIEVSSQLIESKENINFLALMVGGFYAIHYAHKFPARVNRIVFLGACYKYEVSERPYNIFLNGIIRLVSRSPLLTRTLLHFGCSKLRDRSHLTGLFTSLYQDSVADMKIVNREFSSEETLEALQQRVVNSERSIVQDWVCMAFPNWELLKKLKCELHFIHGAQDPAHRPVDIRTLAEQHNARLDILKDAGQLVYYEHIESVMRLL